MIETKSIEEVTRIIMGKINMMLIEQLPTPSCPRKKQQNDWKIEQVKIKISELLNDQSGAK